MAPTDQVTRPADSEKGEPSPGFEPNRTLSYQPRMKRAPKWLSSFLASNNREKNRMRLELGKIKGAIPLLMKPRNGNSWTPQERIELRHILRAASAVYPYLIIWALPGSLVLLPFLAWHLDVRRKNRERNAAVPPGV